MSHTTTYAYDGLNRLAVVTDALTHTTHFGYDAVGNTTVITDANDHATRYAYDALYRLESVTDALGGVTRYRYDALGNMTCVTNTRGYTTTYTYDALNRLASVSDPLAHTWTYTYDIVGNLVGVQDANGVTTQYVYDALNRQTGIDYADPDGDVSFVYDGMGNRTAMTDPGGTTTYLYDALNRPLTITHPAGQVVGYAYDAAGNRTRLIYPGGQQVDYVYDALNRLQRLTTPGGESFDYVYDAAGRLRRVESGPGWQYGTWYVYDAANRLVELQNEVRSPIPPSSWELQSAFDYGYDAVGNRTQAVETLLTDTVTITYGYDDLYRLSSALYSSGESYAYTYDAAGNRLSEVTNGSVVTYTYDAANQLTRKDTDALLDTYTVYEYDANGSQTYWRIYGPWSEDGRYHYDAAGQLVQIERRLPKYSEWFEEVAAFEYNGDGLRVSQTLHGETTLYVWDVAAGLPQVLLEGPYLYNYGHTLLKRLHPAASVTLRYELDGLGSVRRTRDDVSGQVVAYRYAPFGALLEGDGGDNTRRFTGESYACPEPAEGTRPPA